LIYEIDRNPMPDYYSITLEISRDRTTSAQQVTCTEPSACPTSVDVGDVFLRRDINTACHKMVLAAVSVQFFAVIVLSLSF